MRFLRVEGGVESGLVPEGIDRFRTNLRRRRWIGKWA
jgi:hypothetical protein